MNIYITSTAENLCIFLSSNGPTSYAPHLAVTVKKEEAYVSPTVASSAAPAAVVPPTDSPTVDDRPQLEPWKAYVDISGRLYYCNHWRNPVGKTRVTSNWTMRQPKMRCRLYSRTHQFALPIRFACCWHSGWS